MTPPRFPATVLLEDDDQVSLLVDCAGPQCRVGIQEVIVYVHGMSPAERAAALRRAAEERALCDFHAAVSAATRSPGVARW